MRRWECLVFDWGESAMSSLSSPQAPTRPMEPTGPLSARGADEGGRAELAAAVGMHHGAHR